MKLFLTSIAFWLGLAFAAQLASAQGEDAPALLIVTVSGEDDAAARLLRDLTHEPSEQQAAPDAREPQRAMEALLHSSARRAVVLDTQERTVRVIERSGSPRTRRIEGLPTPYVVAFVASELLTLAPPAPPPVAPPASPPPPVRASFRLDGSLAFEVARAYTTGVVLRPKLALDGWLSKQPKPRVLTLLGVEVAGPSVLRRDVNAARPLSLTRWDLALRVGVVLPFGVVRWLTFARGMLGVQTVDPPDSAQAKTRISLGLGLGTALEVGLTRWLALRAGVDVGAQLRRQQFTYLGDVALREHLLFVSGSLGLVLSTPWQ